MKFRPLREDEIEVRVGRVFDSGSGVELLLYKTSRTDMCILDETVGNENWQCEFYEQKGTLFCKVGILVSRADGLCEWVWKDNAGSPSNMEAQKGEASDALKRAGSTWGIGRELYTAPRIVVYSDRCNIKQGKNGKMQCYDDFRVEKIRTEDGRITGLSIWNDSANKRAFTWVRESDEQ